MKRLTEPTIKMISNNGLLFGKIADELKIAPAYLVRLLVANSDERLVSGGVLELIKNHLAGMQDMILVEDTQAVA